MNRQNRWLLLGMLMMCAIVCYAIGFISGVIVFITIGAISELLFWVGAFRKFQKLKSKVGSETIAKGW